MFTPKTRVSKGTMSVPPHSPVSAPRKPTTTDTSHTTKVKRRTVISGQLHPSDLPPSMDCAPGPDDPNSPKRPGPLQKSIHRTQQTGCCKGQDESRRALLQSVKNHHCCD